jgi:hypothetical protein
MRRGVNAWLGIVTVLVVFVAAAPAMAQRSLVSIKAEQPPTIDGTVEAAWEKAPAYKITVDQLPYKPSNGYKGRRSPP